MGIKIADLAGTVLALGITDSDVEAQVASTALFPALSAGDYFYATIEDSSGNKEIVKVTGLTGDVYDIVRAQAGTTARAFDAGSVFQLRVSAVALETWMSEFETEFNDALSDMQDDIDALKIAPAGTPYMHLSEILPTGFLWMDGAAYSRTTYAALYAAIGTRYGAGDGLTTFNVPDVRGLFPRFWDNGAGIDLDSATRTDRGDGTGGDVPGSKQDWAIVDHRHIIYYSVEGLSQGGANCMDWIELTATGHVTGYSQYMSQGSSGVSADNISSNEVHPANMYFAGIIKY